VTDETPFPGGQAPGRHPTRPDPASSRSSRGGTPRFDVLIRLRARDALIASDRVSKWADALADYASVEFVSVRAVVGELLVGALGPFALDGDGHHDHQEEPMSDDAAVVAPGPGRKIHVKHNPADTVAYEARVYQDGERTTVVGYGMTRDRAVANARAMQDVVDGGAEPDEWVDF
jgi:hypothetical protein